MRGSSRACSARAQLNVADLMVAPSLALMLYRPDVRPQFEGRAALELVDRLLPEPTAPLAQPDARGLQGRAHALSQRDEA